MKDGDILNEVDALARFTNLEEEGVEEFRQMHADFVPPGFWGGAFLRVSLETGETLSSGAFWKSVREALRKSWTQRFPLEASVRLISMTDRMSEMDEQVAWVASMSVMTGEEKQAALKKGPPTPKVWPIQRAVMYLAVNAWRVKICRRCGSRFAALKPKSAFCSPDCFHEALKNRKRKWWGKSGTKWREANKKKKRG
jgi:hypothetical protein